MLITSLSIIGVLATGALEATPTPLSVSLKCIAALEYPDAFSESDAGVTEAKVAWRQTLVVMEPDMVRQSRLLGYYREGLDSVGVVDRRISVRLARLDVEENGCLSVETQAAFRSRAVSQLQANTGT